MKITVESLNNGDAKVTLNWNGKDYSETWTNENGTYKTTGKTDIICKMEKDGICANDTDLSNFLDSIEVTDFIDLTEREKDWDE